jgi:GAF domain-containing protein
VAVENQGPEDTGSPMAPPGTRAGIGVPISERGEVIGALVVGTGEDRRWTNHDRRTMAAYGEHVGQGFLLGRPADAAATTKLLLARA